MNQTNTHYQKGQTVEIFEMWRTKERSEGPAKLIKFIEADEAQGYEYWTVQFPDGYKYERYILIPGHRYALVAEQPAPNQTNNNTQHTPGPWNSKMQGFKYTIGNADTGATKRGHDYTVAEIDDNSMQAEANARLIAASPEILEALQALSKLVTMSDLAFSPENVNAKAAIRKATGNQ